MIDIQRDILPLKNEMYRLALRITQNSQEAEDVVQDVIIKVWKMREQMEEVENIEAYLLRMTRNLSLDRQRMKVNQTESIDALPHSGTELFGGMAPSADEQLLRNERIESIRAIMELMPEKLRTAMLLRDFEGHSYKEIGEVMKISEDQVKVCIFRARQFVKSKVTVNS